MGEGEIKKIKWKSKRKRRKKRTEMKKRKRLLLDAFDLKGLSLN
jgi:hypothetical protein